MLCRVFWEKALAGRGNEGVSDIGEDLDGATFWRVKDEPDAEFVGGAFEAESDHSQGKEATFEGRMEFREVW